MAGSTMGNPSSDSERSGCKTAWEKDAPFAAVASQPGLSGGLALRSAERTVLLVEEAPGVRAALAHALRRPHVRVLTSGDAEEALRLLERRHVDLLIADDALPGLSGIELLESARKRRPRVTRVLLTASCDYATFREATNRAGVSFVLGKPWEQSSVQGLIETLLESDWETETLEASSAEALAQRIAHELRNPITALSNAASLLRSTKLNRVDEQRLLSIVLEESERLNRIVGDALAMTKGT